MQTIERQPINVRIRMMNGADISLALTSSMFIHQLKQLLAQKMSIPMGTIRLIYQGRVLKEADQIATYDIRDGHVIHLVTAAERLQEPPTEPEPGVASGAGEENEDILSNIIRGLSNRMAFRRTNRRFLFQQNAQALINRSSLVVEESLEVLRQNLHITENLLHAKTPLAAGDSKPAFQLELMKLQVGQWVDVKDTIDQWLEGQITKIAEGKAFVHYNGWGNRWDEWIDVGSPRLAMFRSHTLQFPSSRYSSPCPNITPDAENHDIPSYRPTFKETLKKSSYVIEKLHNLLELYINIEEQDERNSTLLRTEEEKIDPGVKVRKTQLASQLGPIFDRVGRMINDLAPHFANLQNSPAEPARASALQEKMQNVPLIANNGDITTITNIMDRFLFGEAPSIELHVHAFLNQGNRDLPRPPVPSPPQIPQIPQISQMPPAVPSPSRHTIAVQSQSAPKIDQFAQTEERSTVCMEAQTDTKNKISSAGAFSISLAREERKIAKPVTPLLRPSPTQSKSKMVSKRTIIRNSPTIQKEKAIDPNLRIIKPVLSINYHKRNLRPNQ